MQLYVSPGFGLVKMDGKENNTVKIKLELKNIYTIN